MSVSPDTAIDKVLSSLDSNLPFVSELLQADIRLFVRREDSKVYVHNYFHPNQDSLYMGRKLNLSQQGEQLKPHKDISVDRAFRLGKTIVGQYGLVINNRRIQEFAYPLFGEDKQNPIVVIAVERDIYTTRNVLGQHWDFIADILIKNLQEKLTESSSFPQVSFGEGAIYIKEASNNKGEKVQNIFFANQLAVTLVSELADNVKALVGRNIEEIFGNFPTRYKGEQHAYSIELMEEISLRQRTVVIRYVRISPNMLVALIKDNSEIKIKETLLKEIHHRVKNNLQTIISLLRMQRRRNPDLKAAFTEAINRTNSIALVHEHLARSSDIESVDFGFLMQTILKGLISSFGAESIAVDFECPHKVFIQSEAATNLALVFNEILSNTLEHTAGKLNSIKVKLHYDDTENLHMVTEDDGGGFEEGFDYKQSTGLGWEIIRTISEESLKGKMTVENYERDSLKGLRVHLVIPKQ